MEKEVVESSAVTQERLDAAFKKLEGIQKQREELEKLDFEKYEAEKAVPDESRRPVQIIVPPQETEAVITVLL